MNIETLSKGLSYASFISVFIPLILCLINYKAFNKQLKALFIYILACLVTEIFGLISLKYTDISYPVSYLFSIVETSLISYLFYQEWDNKFLKKNTIYFFSFFLLMSVGTLIITKSIASAESIALPIEFTLIIILSIVHFHKVFTDLTIPKLTNYHFFWFSSAFLLYFGTNFFLTIFYTHIKTRNIEVMYLVGCIPLIMSITYNILLGIGIWKIKQV